MATLIKDIPEEFQEKRGWRVTVNGKRALNVSRVTIENPRFGELHYGLTPGGYDGWSFHEVGGGGSVIIPFAQMKGELFIGMVRQFRHNQGDEIWNVPRGFLEPNETHFEAAKREATEETGFYNRRDRLIALPGLPMNPNSAFFETKTDEGVRIFGLRILEAELEPVPESSDLVDAAMTHQFKPGILKPVSKQAEKIIDCKFSPWYTAAITSDMFTVAAIARLVAYCYGSTGGGRVCP